MADTLDIFGKRYNNVTGIIATDSGGNELMYTRGGSGADALFTMSANTSTGTVTVTSDKTYSELVNYINVPIIIDLYVDGEHSDYLPGRSYMTYDDHKTFDVYGGGNSIMAIEYYSNGNIVFLEKSPLLISLTATQNGTYTPGGLNLYDEVVVNVPTGTARTASDLTVSGATVTVPAGLYSSQATKSVASGTAGTPTATKGTVSNHSISVTPSVTNTTGYITGSTKTGTAVTVSASELVSGSETKTANGTYDVTNLASLVVNVSGGSSNFTLLGTQTVGSINTTSTTATDTGVTITVKGVYAYDLLVCECSVDTKTNNRHAATTRLCWLTASSAVATKDAGTFATATWNCKLSSNGTATTRSNTTTYGVYANGITLSAGSTGDNGQAVITIYRRYNSTQTGTINGSYTMRVYGVKIYDLIGG